jgi:pimeloyl-ACP methyl ester carboxylesterase
MPRLLFRLSGGFSNLECVVEAAEVSPFTLLGISQGAAVAFEYAVRHPERVRHLVLYGGFIQGRLKRDPTPAQVDEAETLLRLVRIGWGQNNSAFRKILASLFVPDASSEQISAFDALQRASTSPENAERFLDAFNNSDALNRAAQVTVPTSVLRARNELEIPMAQGRLMAATIPGARLVSLDSQNHCLGETEPAWQDFLNEIDSILD